MEVFVKTDNNQYFSTTPFLPQIQTICPVRLQRHRQIRKYRYNLPHLLEPVADNLGKAPVLDLFPDGEPFL